MRRGGGLAVAERRRRVLHHAHLHRGDHPQAGGRGVHDGAVLVIDVVRGVEGGHAHPEPLALVHVRGLVQIRAAVARAVRGGERLVRAHAPIAWAGAFGESDTGLPQIGPIDDSGRVHAVMGFGGNGITYSVIASQVIGAAIRGAVDPDADLYRA